MVSDEALKKLQERIAAWPMTQRFVVQQLIEDCRKNREDLRAYKATGLEPEQCENAKTIIESAFSDDTSKAERIWELLKADKDGRLVVLPCKVGDTVYLLFCGNPNYPVISTLKINTVSDAVKLIGKMGMHKYIGRFLTREEAEKALEAMKDD